MKSVTWSIVRNINTTENDLKSPQVAGNLWATFVWLLLLLWFDIQITTEAVAKTNTDLVLQSKSIVHLAALC
jgi:hypothetical protein